MDRTGADSALPFSSNMVYIDSKYQKIDGGYSSVSFSVSGYRQFLVVVSAGYGSPSASLDGSGLSAVVIQPDNRTNIGYFLTGIVSNGSHTIVAVNQRSDSDAAECRAALFGIA